jgi:tRNA/tmRNA/rRNA uracil-C5-methylase (TrmA/RlmC/RlmD family)
MSWSRAMGSAACDAAVRFVASAGARTVVDPFCGLGSVLAAANAHGLDAIGIELSRRRARRARSASHAAGPHAAAPATSAGTG